MPANASSRPVRTAKRVAGLVTATLVLAGLVIAGVVWWPRLQALPAVAGASTLTRAAVLGGGLVVLLALAFLLSGRGRRTRRERTQDALSWFDGLHVCGVMQSRNAEPDLRRAADGSEGDAASERVLRLQVRSLEQALEGQEQRLADAVRDGHRQALLTLDALRGSLVGEPGEVALNRVEAALRRLGSTPSFIRPVLGSAGPGTVVLPAPQPLVTSLLVTSAVETAPEPMAEPIADASAPESATDVPAEEPAVAAEPTTGPAPEAPVVRPVPAFPAREVPHRARRRFRRTVAA